MPADCELNKSERIVMSRGWGKVTDSDMLAHMERIRELFEGGVLDSTWAQLFDLSTVDTLDVSTECIQTLASNSPWPAESIRVLVSPTDLEFGLGRMYQIMNLPRTKRIHVVRSAADAWEYIKHDRLGNSNNS